MGDARIVLTTLISERLLSPGPKKLYVSYYRKRVYADLLPDGSIRFKDQIYTSPVPCALHMKRTLNPSLKTDAGWSSMYSAASGESLKDMKDRVNIRKRGTNVRSAQKEKRVSAPSPISKDHIAGPATLGATLSNENAAPKCSACQTEALTDVVKCCVCYNKTHFKCASPVLLTTPPAPWYCERCLTGQANRILEFLQQTRRVLVERIDKQKKVNYPATSADINERNGSVEIEEEGSCGNEAQAEAYATDHINGEADNGEKERDVCGTKVSGGEIEEMCQHFTGGTTPVSEMIAVSSYETATSAPVDKTTTPAKEVEEVYVMSNDALKGNEINQEAIGAIESLAVEQSNGGNITLARVACGNQHVIPNTPKTSSVEEKFLVLIDTLIAEVSSKPERTYLIANSTGATLVHLEKTQLVQLVEYGKREIHAATRPDRDDKEDPNSHGSNNTEVEALIKIFDLRHQILSSQSQFERTTSAIAKRTEKHLRNAESDLMELEESRAVEARAITRLVDLIEQYSSDLKKCDQQAHLTKVLLESINHRRDFIRSANIKGCFVPSYRFSTNLMTTSSDQLLHTVLLDKLRDITDLVNEWTKMECHYEKMTASLNKSLSLIGNKRMHTDASVKLPPTPPVFAMVNIPPSRRLIERQITNYDANLNAIRQNRARMRKTLSSILKIAREEHLSEEIVNVADILYQKCRDLKIEEMEEQLRIKEEAEAEAKAQTEEQEQESEVFDCKSTDGGEASENEPEAKKQRLSTVGSVISSQTDEAVALLRSTTSSDGKEISSLLGSEDSDAKESDNFFGEGKLRASRNRGNDKVWEEGCAIADITSANLPNVAEKNYSRIDLNSPPMKSKAITDVGLGSFSSCGVNGVSEMSEHQSSQMPKPSSQDQQSFLDQGLEILSMQQQQQRLEREHIKQQRRMEEQRRNLERQQHQSEQRQQLEQQRLIDRERQEREHQERERQERERQERDHVEKQHRLERQRLENIRLEQDRREQQRQEQQQHEQEHLEQQHLEEQRRLEQQRLEQHQRLEQQRLEKQHLEQQRLERQCQEKQRLEQQQRTEKQRQEQQRRLELQRRQQEQQRHEHQSQFQHTKASSLPQVVPSHLQMLNQQQLQHQQAALQQQQHARQIQHPLYGDMSKGILMSSGIGNTTHQDLYAQQATQMGMEMHDVTRHQDSSHFAGSVSGGLRGPPFEVSRSVAQQPAPTAPRTSFYGSDGQMHAQDVFGSQGLPGQPRQLSDHHHMFANELQQQQSDQARTMGGQEFLMSRSYRGLNDDDMQHSGMEQSDHDDVNMSDWQ